MRPVGVVTRGTTAERRLRRADRWLIAVHRQLLRRPDLLIVDLGFGAAPVTTIELAQRVRRINPAARVVGLDISPERVAAAQTQAAPGLGFGVGGFELAGHRPHLVRAFNVLRQYDVSEVPDAWERMREQLSPGGLVLDGTCDETGRLASWIALNSDGPQSLTLALDPAREPSAVAARLPKALIHHNIAGQPIHRLLTDLDAAWHAHAALGAFGVRQRLAATGRQVRARGWALLDGPGHWRHGLVTVAWRALMVNSH